MGIKGLKKLVPTQKLKDFPSAFPGSTLRIDAANLMIISGLKHALDFADGVYTSSVRSFQLQLQFYVARDVKIFLVSSLQRNQTARC
jgi:hypothetical protein